jgi:hypothetical protein
LDELDFWHERRLLRLQDGTGASASTSTSTTTDGGGGGLGGEGGHKKDNDDVNPYAGNRR